VELTHSIPVASIWQVGAHAAPYLFSKLSEHDTYFLGALQLSRKKEEEQTLARLSGTKSDNIGEKNIFLSKPYQTHTCRILRFSCAT